MARMIVAAVLGGLIVFFWGFASHVLLPIHGSSMKAFPQSASNVADFFGDVPQSGVYYFPECGADGKLSDEAKKHMENGPRVTMAVVRKEGGQLMAPKQLALSAALSMAAALVAAIVLASTSGGLARKVFVTTLLGAFSALAVHMQFWVWFEYPNEFVAAYLIDSVVPWFLVGIVMAKVQGGGKKG